MSLNIIKKFTINESSVIFNLNYHVYFDNNGSLQVTDDKNNILLEYVNNKPIDDKLKQDYIIQNIYDVTKITKTKGLLNNDPKDTNPILSPNGEWVLYRDINIDASKEYKPIYNIAQTYENNNINTGLIILCILLFFCVLFLIYFRK